MYERLHICLQFEKWKKKLLILHLKNNYVNDRCLLWLNLTFRVVRIYRSVLKLVSGVGAQELE